MAQNKRFKSVEEVMFSLIQVHPPCSPPVTSSGPIRLRAVLFLAKVQRLPAMPSTSPVGRYSWQKFGSSLLRLLHNLGIPLNFHRNSLPLGRRASLV